MSALTSGLQQLQSRFTWDLRPEDIDLHDVNLRLEEQVELQPCRRGVAARSFSLLAYVRHLQGRPEEALSLLVQSEEETQACYGEDSERRLIVTYGDMAWMKHLAGEHEEAQRHVQRVEDILLKFPTGSRAVLHPEVYGEQAWTYFTFSRSYYPKAIECFHKALELQPDDSEWNLGYAIVLDRKEEAVLERAEDSAAITQLRRALSIDPEDGVLLCLLALKLQSYQNHDEVDGLMQRAMSAAPENPHVLRYHGKYLRSQGRCDEAIAVLLRALDRSPSAFIHHQLALCYKRKKTEEQRSRAADQQSLQQWRQLCIQHLEAAVQIRPSLVPALVERAQLHAEENQLSRAEQLFQSAFLMLPRSNRAQWFYQSYADFLYFKTKDEPGAVKYYTEALKLKPNTREWNLSIKRLRQMADQRLSRDAHDAEAHALLAVAAEAEGAKRRAAEHYEDALDRDRDNERFLQALSRLREELREEPQ